MEGKQSTQGLNLYRNPEDEKWRYNPKRRQNREKAEAHYKNGQYLPFPLHVIIEPTNLCNMMCQMCLRNVMTRPQGMMEWDVFTKIVDEVAAHDVHSISLYMLGEPMLHPRIRDMVNYIKKMGIPYCDVSTNALIDFTSLLGTALDELIVSLDGIDEETYNKNRQGDFRKIESNICRFINEKLKGKYEYPFVRMQIINMESNRPYLNDFIDEWQVLADVVYIKNLEGMVQGLGNKLVSKVPQRDRRPCKQLFYTHNINWNGDHAFCCHDPFGKSVIGNVKNMTIDEAWHHKLKMRELMSQVNGFYGDLCVDCVDWGNW
jgi:MoaA/NifB/PqqE/SkfB family radical SAM enzyme